MRGPSRIPLCQGVALFQLVCCLLFSGNSRDMVLLPAKRESESLLKPLSMCVSGFHANSVFGLCFRAIERGETPQQHLREGAGDISCRLGT